MDARVSGLLTDNLNVREEVVLNRGINDTFSLE